MVTGDEPQFQIHHEHDHVNHECAVVEEIGREWRRQNRIILVPHDVADEIDDQRMIHRENDPCDEVLPRQVFVAGVILVQNR